MKIFNKIGVFLLGVFFTLFILQVYPTVLWFSIAKPIIELWGVIATLIASAVALAIAIWGEWLKQFFFKSNLLVRQEDVLINDQQYIPPPKRTDVGYLPQPPIMQAMVRLFFLNKGNATARDVEVYVTKVYDNGVPRKSFLSVPLPWTHDGKTVRNFHPKQFGYLDFCWAFDAFKTGDNPKLILIAGKSVPNYENIYTEQTEFEITVFQKSAKVKKFIVSLKWTITNRHKFEINSIKEL